MKRKRILCLTLALLMLLGTAACGTQNTASEATPEPAAEELVYAASFQDISGKYENGLSPLYYTDEGVYFSAYEKIGEREKPEDAVQQYDGEYDIYGSKLYYLSYDGTVKQITGYEPLPEPENSEEREDFYAGSSLERLLPLPDGRNQSSRYLGYNSPFASSRDLPRYLYLSLTIR